MPSPTSSRSSSGQARAGDPETPHVALNLEDPPQSPPYDAAHGHEMFSLPAYTRSQNDHGKLRSDAGSGASPDDGRPSLGSALTMVPTIDDMGKADKHRPAESDPFATQPRLSHAPHSAPVLPSHGIQSDNPPTAPIEASQERPWGGDDDDSSDDDYDNAADLYNWSDDDDLDEADKYNEEHEMKIRGKWRGRCSPWNIFSFLGTTFLGNLIVSGALVTPAIVVHIIYRHKSHANRMLADNVEAWLIWAAFNIHVSWWLHFFVEVIPRLFLLLVRIVWGDVSQRLLSYIEIYNSAKGYIKPIFYASMGWGSWAIIFGGIYHLYSHSDPKGSPAAYTYRMYEVVEFFFFLFVIVCVEKIVIQFVSMDFHRVAYADRIAEIGQALAIFDKLKDYRPKRKRPAYPRMNSGNRFGGSAPSSRPGTPSAGMALKITTPPHGESHNRGDERSKKFSWGPSKDKKKKKHEDRRPPMHRHKSSDYMSIPLSGGSTTAFTDPMTPGTAYSTESQPAVDIARKQKGAMSVAKNVGNVAASTLARVAVQDPLGLIANRKTGLGLDINSPAEAKKLAKNLYYSFKADHKRDYLVPSDFFPAFPNETKAKEAFRIFDRDDNGDISKREMKSTVLRVYKERRFLARSMQDVSHAVSRLDTIFLVVALVLVFFIALQIFNVNIGGALSTFYTLGIAFAFVFKESAANVFDSIIFLFVTHPFDTGDRIFLQDEVLVVKKMGLLNCVFIRWDNTEMYISNVLLASMMITNLRRSGYQSESATMQVSLSTSQEKLDALESDMNHWLATEPDRMFEPATSVCPQKLCSNGVWDFEFTMTMTHRANWQDWGARWQHRTAFYAALTYFARKHGIEYVAPEVPIKYWVEDAAALPPRYEQSINGDEPRSPMSALSELSPSDDPVAGLGADGATTGAGGTTSQRANRTFMNFTLPDGEGNAGLRARKGGGRKKAMAREVGG